MEGCRQNNSVFSQIVVTGLACLALVVLVSGQNCPNGEPYFPNAGTVDEFGCTVGYCSKVKTTISGLVSF